MKKILKLIVLLLFSSAGCAKAPDASTFVEQFLNSATEDGNLIPKELLYMPCWNQLPEEQRSYMRAKPGITIFDKEDFRYEVVEHLNEYPDFLNYCVQPSHVLKIYHIEWNPEVVALQVDLVHIEGRWQVVVPALEDSIFEGVEKSFVAVLSDYDKAKSELDKSQALRWKSMLMSDSKYDAIEEVSDHYDIRFDAALLLLSYILNHY